jgi:AraC family L-rhamnose operon transcriptional activator RhaR/AraC family L-rhamnose operon regulatory protein RhaS
MDDLIAAVGTEKNNMVMIAAGVIALVEQFDRIPRQNLGPLEDLRQRLRPAVDLIYREYQENISVDKMASACSMSRTTFYRHFTDVYGKNPKKFLNDLRFDYAMNLLKTSDRKITDIALSTGFFNLSHFNRTFLKKCGMTPRHYRQSSPGPFQPRIQR